MTISVELPRMGENVTEGTIVRWLKTEGDYVQEDEPLVEISTDKIDTELPAPASGVLQKIVAKEDQTIEVGTEIAVIDESASKEGGASANEEEPKAQSEAPEKAEPAAEKEEVPFSRIRRSIAEHMVRSIDTAAHVTNIVEVDITRVAMLRDRAKGDFKRREGFGLTFLPFVASAVIQALRAFPEFNAHLDPEYKTATLLRGVNLGIAVGRDEGLIVPVVHGADAMNLVGLARGINDVAARARTKGGLKPDDVAGGTFTITNGGSFGTLIETPIINQPQAAILGTGAVVKRPMVMTVDGTDAVAIRHMMYLYLSYDHRWIDGHKAAQFNARVKAILEEAD